mgnify:CR=1 FL=1
MPKSFDISIAWYVFNLQPFRLSKLKDTPCIFEVEKSIPLNLVLNISLFDKLQLSNFTFFNLHSFNTL